MRLRMEIREEFEKLVEKLKAEREKISLKVHLASMDAKEELKVAEEKWVQLKDKASKIADETVETSEEYIGKAKIVGEELKETYKRIFKRFTE